MSDAERTIKLDLREVAKTSRGRRPVLVVIQGPGLGLTEDLSRERTVIGRGSAADVVLRDEVASRQHAMVSKLMSQEGCAEYYLTDIGSTNGTFLNGSRVTSEQLLQDGDKIKIGDHMLKFAMLDDFEAEFQERLHQMIQRDELTGLRSRRSLFADLDREIERAAALNDPPPVALLMMDLDHFKKVNDGFGHLIGSQTIRDVGEIIRETLGSADRAARYGGEEFLAYVRGSVDDGYKVAERVRLSVEGHPFSSSTSDIAQTMTVTISIGVACFPIDGRKALDLVQKADQALYRAKLTGRNRTCIFDPAIDTATPSLLAVDASAIIYGPADAQ